KRFVKYLSVLTKVASHFQFYHDFAAKTLDFKLGICYHVTDTMLPVTYRFNCGFHPLVVLQRSTI
ncbi:MAG: hypothetical protein KDE48_23850, partial [Anaerolineales bacterium]|nr:hypothetical protein [Anaerolineales bacterium]